MAGALTIDNSAVNHAALVFQRAPKELRKEMRRAMTRDVVPWLRSAIRRSGGQFAQDRKLANTARIKYGSKPGVVVGGSGRFSGGAGGRDLIRQYEFGGDRGYRNPGYRARSSKGRGYTVRGRRTQRQLPGFQDSGRMVYPAVAEAAPMLVRAWVGIIAETYREAGNG